MAAFEDGLFEHIAGDAAIAAVIGERFTRDIALQETALPYAVYWTVVSETGLSLASASGLTDRLTQIDLFGDEPDTLQDLAELFRLSLIGLRGENLGTTNVRVWVNGFTYRSMPREIDTKLYHTVCEVSLMNSEPRN